MALNQEIASVEHSVVKALEVDLDLTTSEQSLVWDKVWQQGQEIWSGIVDVESQSLAGKTRISVVKAETNQGILIKCKQAGKEPFHLWFLGEHNFEPGETGVLTNDEAESATKELRWEDLIGVDKEGGEIYLLLDNEGELVEGKLSELVEVFTSADKADELWSELETFLNEEEIKIVLEQLDQSGLAVDKTLQDLVESKLADVQEENPWKKILITTGLCCGGPITIASTAVGLYFVVRILQDHFKPKGAGRLSRLQEDKQKATDFIGKVFGLKKVFRPGLKDRTIERGKQVLKTAKHEVRQTKAKGESFFAKHKKALIAAGVVVTLASIGSIVFLGSQAKNIIESARSDSDKGTDSGEYEQGTAPSPADLAKEPNTSQQELDEAIREMNPPFEIVLGSSQSELFASLGPVWWLPNWQVAREDLKYNSDEAFAQQVAVALDQAGVRDTNGEGYTAAQLMELDFKPLAQSQEAQDILFKKWLEEDRITRETFLLFYFFNHHDQAPVQTGDQEQNQELVRQVMEDWNNFTDWFLAETGDINELSVEQLTEHVDRWQASHQ